MSTSVDTMKNFFNVLKLYANDTTANGVAVLDNAIRKTTRFAGLQDAVNHFVADIAYVTATQGAAQSLLQNCGIIIGADYDFTVDTGADGKNFSYTVTYPNDYFEVIDFATAQIDPYGYPDSVTVKTSYLQAGQTYSTVERISGKTLTYSGEEIAASILTMLKGMDNYWLDESLKLVYDSFGVDFGGKNISVEFCINPPIPFSASTGPNYEFYEFVVPAPMDSISVTINSVMFTNLDASDPNGILTMRILETAVILTE